LGIDAADGLRLREGLLTAYPNPPASDKQFPSLLGRTNIKGLLPISEGALMGAAVLVAD
jgi:hypothetical protein